ncbi:MAG: hypothetical protein J6P19_07155, partial [Acetobacter sp.]|nr:hypothetical protein [Acetobacter sp.]
SQYLQPPQLANYYVGCFKRDQKMHKKLTVWSTQKQYYNGRKHYLETLQKPVSKPTSTPMS